MKPSDAGAEVVDYLTARGFLHPNPHERARAVPLTGGVSAETVLVETDTERVVVKRILAKLRVAGDWNAKPERAATEAAAIHALHAMTPDNVPELIGTDAETHTVVLRAAPPDWVNWRSVVLGEISDPSAGPAVVAERLGRVLGTWHRQTWHDPVSARLFGDDEAFEQLRIAPFHRTVAARHPAAAGWIGACIEQLERTHECFVHGDYSPKNVLVGGDGVMVLDYEVAHTGAAVFDVAFMTHHLMLKAMCRPASRVVLSGAVTAFVAAYEQTRGTTIDPLLGAQVCCLLLARVDGLSPAPYLNAQTRDSVRALALSFLTTDDDASLDEIWQRIAVVR